jgi:hypothetical protein
MEPATAHSDGDRIRLRAGFGRANIQPFLLKAACLSVDRSIAKEAEKVAAYWWLDFQFGPKDVGGERILPRPRFLLVNVKSGWQQRLIRESSP